MVNQNSEALAVFATQEIANLSQEDQHKLAHIRNTAASLYQQIVDADHATVNPIKMHSLEIAKQRLEEAVMWATKALAINSLGA